MIAEGADPGRARRRTSTVGEPFSLLERLVQLKPRSGHSITDAEGVRQRSSATTEIESGCRAATAEERRAAMMAIAHNAAAMGRVTRQRADKAYDRRRLVAPGAHSAKYLARVVGRVHEASVIYRASAVATQRPNRRSARAIRRPSRGRRLAVEPAPARAPKDDERAHQLTGGRRALLHERAPSSSSSPKLALHVTDHDEGAAVHASGRRCEDRSSMRHAAGGIASACSQVELCPAVAKWVRPSSSKASVDVAAAVGDAARCPMS